jgi:NADH-quinone oxidoreductase subunit A
MLIEYIPVLIFIAVGLGLAVFFTLCSVYLGPRRPSRVKSEPFECGNPSDGLRKERFSIKFYVIAVLFIIFDIEVVFFFPWATIYRELSQSAGWLKLFGLLEMAVFLGVLALALFYAWKKGALEWD